MIPAAIKRVPWAYGRLVRVLAVVMAALLLPCRDLPAALAPTPPLLAGRVMTEGSGQPLPSAHLQVLGAASGLTVSDSYGHFRFADLPPGEVTLQVSHVGYETHTRMLTLREGMPQQITIILKPRSVETTEPVWITAQRERPHFHLDTRTLETSGWSNAGEAIRSLPGVQLFEQGGAGGRSVVSLRGSRPDHVQVRIDGIPLNGGNGEAVDLSGIPLQGVASIDISPGTRPGAPGGVIDIRTLTAAQKRSDYRVGLEGSYPDATHLHASAVSHSLDLHLDAIRTRGDFNFIDESGENRKRYNNQRERLAAQAGYHNPEQGVRLRLGGALLSQGSPAPLYQPPTPDAHLEEETFRGDLTIQKGAPWGNLHSTLHASSSHRRHFSPAVQWLPGSSQAVTHIPVDLEDKGWRAGVRLKATARPLPLDRSGYEWGVETGYSREAFLSVDNLSNGVARSRTEGEVLRNHGTSEGTVTVQRVAGDWRFRGEAIGRLDLIEDHLAQEEPSRGLEPHFTSGGRLQAAPRDGNWSIFAGAGTAIAPPGFTSRFLVETLFALGNPHLKPERVKELQGGMMFNSPSRTRSLSGSLDFFIRETEDLVIWRRNSRGQYFPDNVGSARAQGGTIALAGAAKKQLVEWQGSLTLQDVRNTTPASIFRGMRIPFQPTWFGNAHLGLGRLNRLRLTLDLRGAGRRYTTESNLDPLTTSGGGLAAYGALDFALVKTFDLTGSGLRVRAGIGIDNLSDARYELLDRMPMPGRVYRASLTLEKR